LKVTVIFGGRGDRKLKEIEIGRLPKYNKVYRIS